jgi:hypothetical protein
LLKGLLVHAGTHVRQTQVRGTPDHILHMVEERRAIVGEFELATSFPFGDTPYDPDRLKLHAKEVLPVLHSRKNEDRGGGIGGSILPLGAVRSMETQMNTDEHR